MFNRMEILECLACRKVFYKLLDSYVYMFACVLDCCYDIFFTIDHGSESLKNVVLESRERVSLG